MKKADLEKMQGRKIAGSMSQGGARNSFGRAAPALPSRREQRRLDSAQGLIPFAVKLDGALVKRLQALAEERKTGLTELVTEVLKKGLGD